MAVKRQAPRLRRFYLVRHGAAVDENIDPTQPLTDDGRETVKRVAAWAVESGVHVDKIWHSGKKRAEQTALIFAKYLKPARGVNAVVGLQPGNDVKPMVQKLTRQSETVLIVSHLPFVSRITNVLLGADQDQETIAYVNARLVGFVQEKAGWRIEMITPSELLH